VAKSKKQAKKKSELLDALKLIGLTQREIGTDGQTHCIFRGGFLSACDGILAAGAFVQEDLEAVVRTAPLIKALERAGDALTVTQLPGKLSVRSGPFRALVPCLETGSLETPAPDPVTGVADDKLRAALNIAGSLASDNAPKLIHASVLLRSGSAVGTNSVLILEAWHGIDLPTMTLPRAFVTALGKVSKPIAQFGFSENSFTVYFEDKSWLRTQVYAEKWPDVDSLLNVEAAPAPLPEGFFAAAESVAAFTEHRDVFVDGSYLGSHAPGQDAAACFEIEGSLSKAAFDGKQLALAAPYVKTADMEAMKGRGMLFFGEGVRGAVAYRA
jgi:hypothetical protein